MNSGKTMDKVIGILSNCEHQKRRAAGLSRVERQALNNVVHPEAQEYEDNLSNKSF